MTTVELTYFKLTDYLQTFSGLSRPVHTSNNVEATFDFVERTKFQRKARSTLLPFFGNNVERCFDIVAGVDRAF